MLQAYCLVTVEIIRLRKFVQWASASPNKGAGCVKRILNLRIPGHFNYSKAALLLFKRNFINRKILKILRTTFWRNSGDNSSCIIVMLMLTQSNFSTKHYLLYFINKGTSWIWDDAKEYLSHKITIRSIFSITTKVAVFAPIAFW